ncbi:hypothetical protein GWI33_002953 [Rhynchophorus ferrugineus]|uniref:GGDEF domain-containing protein n=1 Tax=Rhynchophorus ferrugineus TaxID=354439 RepID=A0A834IPF6_RHYFE|nr:hypothetical protein GWI33_002953 [Rhynchophorus ferrugineus]
MLRRVGNILNQSVSLPYTVSRIGGDEFVILMPGADEQNLQHTIDTINELLHIDNQFYSSLPISVAFGTATSCEHETIEDMIKRADHEMYANKQRYYEERSLLKMMTHRET